MDGKKKILYVKCGAEQRSEVEGTLRQAGYDVRAAHSLQAALAAASSDSFDLILVHPLVSASFVSLLGYHQRRRVPVMYVETKHDAADPWSLLRRLSLVLNSNP